MEINRKPFQGVFNIIQFNWHFYVIAFMVLMLLFIAVGFVAPSSKIAIFIFGGGALGSIIVSLLASYYVYDVSNLYQLTWIEAANNESLIVNIHAGFDETSALLKEKFPDTEMLVLDFYDPIKHTEVSIKRARKAYPPFAGTLKTSTYNLPVADETVDKVFLIFSAHEIRNEEERIQFFKAVYRILKPSGTVYLTEHLRDIPNFLVYNIGFFHFFPKNNWLKIFGESNFVVEKEEKITPFISSFKLGRHGNSF